ncbi:MAG: arsenate reductase ArsC [Candidatus Omnitrophota bacterium]
MAVKQKVLILCTGNSCRSQMAEGILRDYGASRFEVFSAGTKPSSVNPIAIQVMKEIGIDISGHRSKHVDEFKGQTFDYVVTVCNIAKESCPFFPGNTKRLHWEFPDPPHGQEVTPEVLDRFREVRNLICERFKIVAAKGFV